MYNDTVYNSKIIVDDRFIITYIFFNQAIDVKVL